MWFHQLETVKSPQAGQLDVTKTQLKVRVGALALWLATAIILVVLAIIAHNSGWDEGGKDILTIVTTLVGGGGAGVFLGERNAGTENTEN